MAEFIVSQERVQDAVNVIVQFLRDAGYAGSLEDGTGLNDIVVKPSALLREMFAQMVDKASAYQSLQKALELKDVIGDDEYDAAVDCILSNWFVTRNGGKPSTGLVRLWFLQPPDFMQFQDGEAVGTVDGVSLVADGNQVFTESSFSCILNTTENQNEYYVDVAVKTAENSVITPSSTSGAEVSVQYNDIYYLRATLPGTFTPGVLVESSEDFIRRTGQAITTRELITARAINTVLLDSFSDIIRLYVARHGSREQLRDIVRFQGVSVHVGNKADIYIASSLAKQELTVFADANGDVDVAQLPAEVSVVAYISARDADGVELSFSVDCEEAVWCSARYVPQALHVEGQGAVSLTLLTDTVVGQVRDFVYSEEQRVACYDPMVKHMFPLVLRPVLNVELVDRSVDSVSAIKDAVLEYLDYVVVNAQPWVASELIASIHVRVENVKKILLPVACTGSIYDPLTKRNCDIEIGNKFTVGTDFAVRHSDQITDNTVQFYTDRDLIMVVSDYEEA